MPRISTAFVIDDIAPVHDVFWHAAGEGVHRQFWRVVVAEAKEAKARELAEGRDRFGRKLVPITRYTRAHRKSAMVKHADPNAPPLTPGDAYSRTAAYFDGRAHANRGEFFWRNGWGKILHFHKVGARNRWAKSGKLPVRDVIGLSPKQRRVVQRKAIAWWSQYRRHMANVKALGQPPPAPPVSRSPIPLAAKSAEPKPRARKPPRKPAPKPVPTPTPPRPRLTVEKHAAAAHLSLPSVPPPPTFADLAALATGAKLPRRNLAVAGPAEIAPTPPPKPGRLARVGAFFRGVVKKIFGR